MLKLLKDYCNFQIIILYCGHDEVVELLIADGGMFFLWNLNVPVDKLWRIKYER